MKKTMFTLWLFCKYQRHGRYADSCHQRKYLYCKSAAPLQNGSFAVNKYPICAAPYTMRIFIGIYYILVCFLQKSQAISPGFFARKNLLYGYFPAAPSLRHAGLLSSIPTITYRYDFTRPFCTVFHAPRRNTISFITSCCSFVK